MSNIDETIRPMSHRQTVQQYEVYRKGRLAQIELEKKQEFEESLRNSVKKTIPSNSGLFGASKNIFEQNLTKDSAKLIKLNKRKHKMKEDMIDMITDLNEKEFDRFEATMMDLCID